MEDEPKTPPIFRMLDEKIHKLSDLGFSYFQMGRLTPERVMSLVDLNVEPSWQQEMFLKQVEKWANVHKWAESQSDESVARFAQLCIRRDKPIPTWMRRRQEQAELADHNQGLTPEDEAFLKSMGVGEW